jgi:hypothetical protein
MKKEAQMSGFNVISSISKVGSGPATAGNATNTMFGEISVSNKTVVGQGAFIKGYNDILFVSASNGAGSAATVSSGSLIVTAGTVATGSCTVRLKRGIKYRPGQGSITRGTAIFGTPQNNCLQVFGAGNTECGYYFGYQNTNFGIMRLNGGIREVRTLTIAAGVSSTTNVTITLSGVPVTFAIAGGSNVNQTSYEISKQDYTNIGGGWYAEAHDGVIDFIALTVGPRSGSYDATGSGLTATFSQSVLGVVQTTEFVSQSAWNIDTMDGKGVSGFMLNPAKGNVYQVGYQYLGYGNAVFSVENSRTGKIEPCHNFINANSITTPVLRDPFTFARWSVENSGNTVATYVTGASAACFIEGQVNRNIGIVFAATGSKSSVTTEVPILSVRNDRYTLGRSNYGEMLLNIVSAGVVIGGSATRSGVVRVYKNLQLTGPVNFTRFSASRSIASYDTAATGFSLNDGYLLYAYTVVNGASIVSDLSNEGFFIDPGEIVTITVSASDSASFDVTMNWNEDQ